MVSISSALRRFLFDNNMGKYADFADFLVEFLFLVVIAIALMRISAAWLRKWKYTNSEILAIIPSFAVYALVRTYVQLWYGLSFGRQYYGTLVLFALSLGICWSIQERREEKRQSRAEYQAKKPR